MEIKIMVFGQLKEAFGSDSISIENIEDSTQLTDALLLQYPQLKDLSFRIAIDKNLIYTQTPISSSSIIALLPPFSGG
jgi:sulfur-carrier protein